MRLILWLALAAFSAPAFAQENIWSEIKKPSSGPAHSIGSYANGCLAGAKALPIDEPGYTVMRTSRERFYGSPELVEYVKSLAATQGKQLLIGDMAQPRGGFMPDGHNSHQSGLDVDIWYRYGEGQVDRENLSATSLVNEDDTLNVNWDASYVALLKKAAKPHAVDRIFVHAAIKRELCEQAAGQSWLRKIRPWWGHDDHFHVRLKCPATDKDCTPQAPIPTGDGCDASLDWWFSDEAKAEKSKPRKPVTPPEPPDQCKALLSAQ